MRKIWILMVGLSLTACDGEFIPDPFDPRLPRYSEEGKDAAGCFINGDIWRAVRISGGFLTDLEQYLQVQFRSEDSTIHLSIDGYRGASVTSEGSYAQIFFVIDNRLTQFQSLGQLQNQTIILDGQQSYGGVDEFGPFEDNCINGVGQLVIRHAEYIPETTGRYILAGTFSFTVASDSCEQLQVRNGRFDYRVSASEE